MILIEENYELGIAEASSVNRLVVSKESFAPGIWAGIKNAEVTVKTKRGRKRSDILIIHTNLENRELWIIGNDKNYIEAGDKLYIRK